MSIHPHTPCPVRRRLLAGGACALALPMVACGSTRSAQAVRHVRLRAQPTRVSMLGAGHPQVDVWAYDRVPGPMIRARQGDRLRVEVRNHLPQDTTVHWHGIRLPNAMDGVPDLTQPPIAPGEGFVYEFDLPDAGTYWYHPHANSHEQVARGLHGALIVEEPEPIAVDRDLTWVLGDWRLTREGRIAEPFAHPRDVSHAGRIGNTVTLNGVVPGDFTLRRGERLRLRLINVANARIFGLRFDGHEPLVIALDGQPVAPHAPPGGRVDLGPGMRVDLVLDAVGKPGARHLVRDDWEPSLAYELTTLAYDGVPLRDRPPVTPIALPANRLPEPDLAKAQTHAIRFQGGMMGDMAGVTLHGRPVEPMQAMRHGLIWAVNGVIADPAHHHHAPMLVLRQGRTHVLAMHNDTVWDHPIHLHGHSFRVVRRDGRPTAHREWRDTVMMAPDERVDIAFVADNPGDWMLHCHILEHHAGGMMGVLRVA